ncbi:hypothetical protein C0993_010174, partial [Termitomyces sp. T159_Od127]
MADNMGDVPILGDMMLTWTKAPSDPISNTNLTAVSGAPDTAIPTLSGPHWSARLAAKPAPLADSDPESNAKTPEPESKEETYASMS